MKTPRRASPSELGTATRRSDRRHAVQMVLLWHASEEERGWHFNVGLEYQMRSEAKCFYRREAWLRVGILNKAVHLGRWRRGTFSSTRGGWCQEKYDIARNITWGQNLISSPVKAFSKRDQGFSSESVDRTKFAAPERSQTAIQGVIYPARGAPWLKLILNPASSKPVFIDCLPHPTRPTQRYHLPLQTLYINHHPAL